MWSSTDGGGVFGLSLASAASPRPAQGGERGGGAQAEGASGERRSCFSREGGGRAAEWSRGGVGVRRARSRWPAAGSVGACWGPGAGESGWWGCGCGRREPWHPSKGGEPWREPRPGRLPDPGHSPQMSGRALVKRRRPGRRGAAQCKRPPQGDCRQVGRRRGVSRRPDRGCGAILLHQWGTAPRTTFCAVAPPAPPAELDATPRRGTALPPLPAWSLAGASWGAPLTTTPSQTFSRLGSGRDSKRV